MKIVSFLKKEKNLSKDFIITICSQVVLMIITLAINKVNSINLGVTNFSIFTLAKRSVGIVSGIMALSLGISIPRYIVLKRNATNKYGYFYAGLLLVTILSCVLILISFFLKTSLSKLLFDDVDLIYLVMPTIIYSFSGALTVIIYSYYRGCNKYFLYNLVQIISYFAMLISSFLIKDNMKLIFILWSLSNFFITLFFTIIIITFDIKKNNYTFSFKEIFRDIKELFVYGCPRVLGEISLFSFTTIPLIIIAHYSGIENNYLMSVPINVCTTIFPVFSFTGVIFLTYVSNAISENDVKKIKKPLLFIGLVYLLGSFVVCIFISIFPDFFIKLLFSEEYVACSPYLRVIIWSIIPASIYYLLRNPIDALDNVPWNTFALLISFAVLCGMIIIFNSSNYLYALAYVVGYLVLGSLSFAFYIICYKKQIKREKN